MIEIAHLLRHGDYDYEVEPEALTDLGRQQSINAREELIAKGLGGRAYLLSSSAPRALETASIIAEGLGVEVVSSRRLRKGSNTRGVVNHLGEFLAESLRKNGGIVADPNIRFIAVVHAPLIAALRGIKEADDVPNGQVIDFKLNARDPNYSSHKAGLTFRDA